MATLLNNITLLIGCELYPMNVSALKSCAWTIAEHLKEKGLISASYDINLPDSGYRFATITFHYKTREDGATIWQHFKVEDVDYLLDTLQEAAQWAEDLKGIEELEHEQFLKMLGKTLDRAREMGIDTNVINPLEEMMKSLATNALTYKRFAA
jgi:hypothetical protein